MARARVFHIAIILIVSINLMEQIRSNPMYGGFSAANSYSSGNNFFIENNGEYPYMAQLERKIKKKYLCGAVIIKPQFLVTAAHCVYDQVAENLRIRAGTFLVGDETSNLVQVRDVDKFKFSPYFLKKGSNLDLDLDYDIAVVKIRQPLDISGKYVGVINVPSKNLFGKFIHKKVKVLGFGETEMERKSVYLQHANMKIISDNECEQRGGFSSEVSICALGQDHDVGLKCGDSGGALVKHHEGQPTKDILLGVTSSMIRIDRSFRPDLPSVFMEIAFFSKWIANNINAM